MEMSNITARIRDQIASFETKEQIEEIGEVPSSGTELLVSSVLQM